MLLSSSLYPSLPLALTLNRSEQMNPSSSNFSARAHFPAQNRLTEPICVNVDRIPFFSLSKRTFRINLTVYISVMMSCRNGCKSDEVHSTEDFTVQTQYLI